MDDSATWTRAASTICSPFWPHLPHLGRSGALFVGLDDRDLPWKWYDRPATEVLVEHWERLRPELHARAGISPLETQASAA